MREYFSAVELFQIQSLYLPGVVMGINVKNEIIY